MKLLKILKWSCSILRLLKFKIIYGSNINFQYQNLKSLPYIGKNVEIILKNNSKLYLGNRVYLDNYVRIECGANAEIKIGDNVFINSFSRIVALRKIIIGKKSLIASNVSIYDHDHEIGRNIVETNKFIIKECIIGNNVWLCTNVVITKGTEIVDGVVVGANSVITKSVTETGVYCGSPARLIK